jgi:hypothetical protein
MWEGVHEDPLIAMYESHKVTSDFGLHTSDFGLQTSDFGLRTADFGLQTSDFKSLTLMAGVAHAHINDMPQGDSDGDAS